VCIAYDVVWTTCSYTSYTQLLSLLHLFITSVGILLSCNHLGWGPIQIVFTELTNRGREVARGN
jgi:hypothetical protein